MHPLKPMTASQPTCRSRPSRRKVAVPESVLARVPEDFLRFHRQHNPPSRLEQPQTTRAATVEHRRRQIEHQHEQIFTGNALPTVSHTARNRSSPPRNRTKPIGVMEDDEEDFCGANDSAGTRTFDNLEDSSSSSSSASPGKEQHSKSNNEHSPRRLDPLLLLKPAKRPTLEEALGWDTLRQHAAALDRQKLHTTEESLVRECSDLPALRSKMGSLTSELRTLEQCYPTHVALLQVVADAVDELTAAVVEDCAEQLHRHKQMKSAEHAKMATAPLLEELQQMCYRRDDAVKRIAAVRVWRDQLGTAMERQKVPLEQRVTQERDKLEKDQRDYEATVSQLRALFEQNASLISQIARVEPLQEQLDKYLFEVRDVEERKEGLANRVAELIQDNERRRKEMVRDEQRFTDQARLVRARQQKLQRQLDDHQQIVSKLHDERDEVKAELLDVRDQCKKVLTSYHEAEAAAFVGWTPRSMYIEPLAVREERQRAFDFMMKASHHHQQHHRHSSPSASGSTSTTIPPLLNVASSRRQPFQQPPLLSVGASLGDALGFSPRAAGRRDSNPTSVAVVPRLALRRNPAPPTAPSTPALSPSSSFRLPKQKREVAVSKTFSFIENVKVANNPLAAVSGVDTAGLSTSEVVDAIMKKITSTAKEMRKTHEEWKKIERITNAIHEPVVAIAREAAAGFDAAVDTSPYLMRYMGAAVIPSFLREPKSLMNEKWDFARTEECALDYLVGLSAAVKRGKADAQVVGGSSTPDASAVRLQYETTVLRALAQCAAIASVEEPSEGSVQFSAGRRFAYHLLHHGNHYKRYSPIIRAALATFGCALPLDFIDAPLALLRTCFEKFLAADATAEAVAAAIATAGGAAAPASFSTALHFSHNASNLFLNSGTIFGAHLTSSHALVSLVEEGSNPAAVPAPNKVLVAMMQVFGHEFAAVSHVVGAGSSLSSTGFSLSSPNNLSSASVLSSKQHGQLSTQMTAAFGPVDVMQIQHAVQLDSGIAHIIDEVTRCASPSAYRKLVFDFQAGLSKRPMSPAEAPSLVLRCTVDLFLRRHERVARALELAACSVARPLGETSQMVVADADLLKTLSGLRIDTTATLLATQVHPSLLRAMETGLSMSRKLAKVKPSVLAELINALPPLTIAPGLAQHMAAEQQQLGGEPMTANATMYDLNDLVSIIWTSRLPVE